MNPTRRDDLVVAPARPASRRASLITLLGDVVASAEWGAV
jgi:hypothetical protein